MPPREVRRHEWNPIKILVGATWLYPIKGIFYFFAHPSFWPLFSGRLLAIVLLSTFVYALLFTFAFLPQVAILALFHGPGAWLNGVVLTLGEGSAIVALLFEAFFVDETLVDVFDAVLIDRGCQELVMQGRVLDDSAPNSVKMLGKPTMSAVYSPFSLRQIVEFVFLLPLNFVPIIGVPLFLILTGYRAGPLQHWRLFKLRDLTKKERNKEIKKRQLKYTWFGTVHLALQLVPGLSMFFLLTSAAGSALWAAKLEKERTTRSVDIIRPSESYRDDPA